VLSKARDCCGEIGIVRTALDDRPFLNQPPIFPIQIEPRLDRDRAMVTECDIVWGYKGTHFSPGIRARFEAPLYVIGGVRIASRGRLETPFGEMNFSHMQDKIAAQLF